MTPKLSLYP
ncbi:hypothetical protein AALO_G00146310 [Alosa alosa]|uniref:Uncharacterized protein n=1 Tax=Alosa alosa TaxID=278164 RepID=A0AAV6GR27_9TELE|nr:hypothetical protein AALO_G00146310 [Alosa alosa]